MKSLLLFASAAALLFHCLGRARADALPSPVPEDLYEVSVPGYDMDDRALASVLRRAENGEDLTIALIGGSITMGTVSVGASDDPYPDRSPYARLFFSWWQETFPKASFTFVNAGIGGTDSYLGVHRVAADVLRRNPDLVLVEFSVNDDGRNAVTRYAYDSLVRTILKAPSSPAVLLLFMGQTNGATAQAVHQTIGKAYRLPSVSASDVFQAMIREKVHTAAELSGDQVHPSALGHQVVASLLTRYLSGVLARASSLEEPAPFDLPPVTEDRYPACHIEDYTSATVLSRGCFNEGTSGEFYKKGWTALKAGEGITFETDCARLGILYLKTVDGKSGRARILVDGQEAAVLDADFTGGWGNAITAQEVFAQKENGKHLVTVEPLDGKFTLLGLMVTRIPE